MFDEYRHQSTNPFGGEIDFWLHLTPAVFDEREVLSQNLIEFKNH